MPATTFNADQVLDPDTAKHGPLDVMVNQEEWIPCNKPDTLDWGEDNIKRPRNPLKRLLFRRLFLMSFRLEPPAGEDLYEAGKVMSEKLGLGTPARSDDPSDKAIWITGAVYARNAAHALGSCGNAMKRLDGVLLEKAQIRVASLERLETLQ